MRSEINYSLYSTLLALLSFALFLSFKIAGPRKNNAFIKKDPESISHMQGQLYRKLFLETNFSRNLHLYLDFSKLYLKQA